MDPNDDGPLSPQRAPMRRTDKELSDHLGPLRRYLRRQVGRPWDKVYSEIRRGLPDGMHGEHIMSHVRSDVGMHCEEINGVIKVCTRWGHSNEVMEGELYVHPRTGILCVGKHRKRRPASPERVEHIKLEDNHEYRLIDGIWYYQEFVYVMASRLRGGRYTENPERQVVKKRQLNSRELARLGLKNETQE
jgi:hypothetical protein